MSTPLVAAILAGHREVAQYLLDHGASADLESALDGLTPLEAAAEVSMALRVD
jgi:ankyrin repeat protein